MYTSQYGFDSLQVMSREWFADYISPALENFDSETMHNRAREALHLSESNKATLWLLEKFADKHERFRSERLNIVVGGVELENPVIVGAGWDKAGRAVRALWRLGFAGVEVGSVLAYPQDGNPKPREFIIGPGVSLNRMGFNSPGVETVSGNLDRYVDDKILTGISIGKNKIVDIANVAEVHAVVASRLYDYASYFVINVSSPNTPGLRDLQEKKPLTDIVQAVNDVMSMKGGRKPLFIKIAPELTNTAIDDVIEVVIANNLAGIIAANTTTNERIKSKYKVKAEPGGLAGNDDDYRKLVNEKIKHIYKSVGKQIDIIGVGGVNSWQTALEKIEYGAKVVQVVTGIREVGPTLPGKINRGLDAFLEREGINSVAELVGIKS